MSLACLEKVCRKGVYNNSEYVRSKPMGGRSLDLRSDTCAVDKWYEADKERKERLERIVRSVFVKCG